MFHSGPLILYSSHLIFSSCLEPSLWIASSDFFKSKMQNPKKSILARVTSFTQDLCALFAPFVQPLYLELPRRPDSREVVADVITKPALSLGLGALFWAELIVGGFHPPGQRAAEHTSSIFSCKTSNHWKYYVGSFPECVSVQTGDLIFSDTGRSIAKHFSEAPN